MPRSIEPARSPAHRRFRRSGASFALFAPFLGIALGLGAPEDLPRIAAAIEARFPEVRHVAPAALERELAAPPAERPLLLDVRSAEEYAVSHLEGAVRAETVEEALEVLAAHRAEETERGVVLYCAVGLRSAELAAALSQRGVDRVRNLRGSLFAWANSGRPLVRDGEPVAEVHPFDATWGKLLRAELWAPVRTGG